MANTLTQQLPAQDAITLGVPAISDDLTNGGVLPVLVGGVGHARSVAQPQGWRNRLSIGW